MKYLFVFLAASLVGCSAGGHRISIWASDAELSGSGVSSSMDDTLHEHPCGAVRSIRVHRLPAAGQPGHVPGTDEVVEYDPEGHLLRRWAVPVDALPLAIDGQRLFFSHYQAMFSVDTSGRLTKVASHAAAKQESVECPAAIVQEFKGSDFLGCSRMTDVATGKHRLIAAEGVCS